MIYYLYSIKDVVTGEFGSPITCVNEEVAKRTFRAILNENKVCAKDLELYCVGTFNKDNGCIVSDSVNKICDYNVVNSEG